jgi:hypothetical protein
MSLIVLLHTAELNIVCSKVSTARTCRISDIRRGGRSFAALFSQQ